MAAISMMLASSTEITGEPACLGGRDGSATVIWYPRPEPPACIVRTDVLGTTSGTPSAPPCPGAGGCANPGMASERRVAINRPRLGFVGVTLFSPGMKVACKVLPALSEHTPQARAGPHPQPPEQPHRKR